MRYSVPVGLVAVLVIAAFAAGYVLHARTDRVLPLTEASTVSQVQTSPGPSTKSRGQAEKAIVRGTIEAISNGTLVVRVAQAPGLPLVQGARLTVDLRPDTVLMREITRSDLTRGSSVNLRGSLEGGRFIVRQLTVELTR
jgi:hypothetical protein